MKNTAEPLDLTQLETHQKCLAVFNRFDELRQGEYFIVEHDEDPVFLYHHLLEARAEPFEWKRLEDGPFRWQVRITKVEVEESGLPIGRIAVQNYLKAEVFQRLGIPYCCSGTKTLKEACEEAGISQDVLKEFYAEALRYKAKKVHSFEKWETDFLAEYIIRTHHVYVKQNIPEILDLSLEVAQEQENAFPEVVELAERVHFFLHSLSDHMQREEQELFPRIKKLVARKKKNFRLEDAGKPRIGTTIQMLEKEHQQAGKDLKDFRKITRNYRLPKGAGDSCTHLYAKLLEFENDLVQHIHLENNLLFPKAVLLEKELMESRSKVFARQPFQATVS